MIYTKEVENMCPVAKGAKHEFILRKLRTFQDLHTVLAGVHHSRVPASFPLM